MSIEIEFYLFGLLTGFAIAMGVMWIWEIRSLRRMILNWKYEELSNK